MSTELPSFSLVLDQKSPVANSPRLITSAKAHIVLQIIMSGRLFVSDTQCLVAQNVARLLRIDGLTRELVREKRLCLAIRDTHPRGTPSPSLSELVGIHRDTAQDASGAVRFIDDNAHIVRWRADTIAANYASQTKSLFLSRFADEEPDLASVTRDFIYGMLVKHSGRLNRIHFDVDLPQHIEGHNIPIPPRTLSKIHDFAAAYYLGAVPAALGLDAVYGDEHRRSVACRVGIDSGPTSEDALETTSSHLELSKLVEGLANLPVDDILALAEGPEASACRRLMQKDNGLPDDHRAGEIIAALQLLNLRIDEAILRHVPSWSVPDVGTNVRVWRRRRQLVELTELIGGSALDVAALVIGWNLPPFLGSTIGGFSVVLTERIASQRDIRAGESAMHRARMMLLEESLRRDGKGATIPLNIPGLEKLHPGSQVESNSFATQGQNRRHSTFGGRQMRAE